MLAAIFSLIKYVLKEPFFDGLQMSLMIFIESQPVRLYLCGLKMYAFVYLLPLISLFCFFL